MQTDDYDTETPHGMPIQGHKQDEEDNEYATPPKIWRPLGHAVGGWDLDPCSGAEPTPIAPKRYTEEDDGLVQPWEGAVFVNPPWSSNGDASAKHAWLTKARNEAERDAVDVVVVLLPAETSSHWWQDHMLSADALCLVGPGRIPFIGQDRNPSFGLAIAAFGHVDERLRDVLHSFGSVIQGRKVVEPTAQTALPDGGR